MKNQPQSTEGTNDRLKQALLRCMEQKPLSQISVKDVTDTAGCNRTTFYEYFTGLDPLLAQLFSDLLPGIGAGVSVWDALAEAACSHFKEYSLLLGENGSMAFAHMLAGRLLSAFPGDSMSAYAHAWGAVGVLVCAAGGPVPKKAELSRHLSSLSPMKSRHDGAKSLSLRRGID